ncbi:MAG: hypothetical protein ONB44_06570 [candidate division KSB1 bacterium]|nr:hypothetical protein [candidate division KSB1 bacterium]MDZ7301787.1 hypothetical protein [candidate division KSB1 bacterium]MDZ7311434.1 hypothetical protein [candidate division KSB1 bacterium]
MVVDTKGDTGFVLPIRAAERLSNIRFGLLPQIFSSWGDLKKQTAVLRDRVSNLELQTHEALGIAERRKQEIDDLNRVLTKSEKELVKKNRLLKFYRATTVVFGITTATLFIMR